MDLLDLNQQVHEQATGLGTMGSFQSIQQEMYLLALEIWSKVKNLINYIVENFRMQKHIWIKRVTILEILVNIQTAVSSQASQGINNSINWDSQKFSQL